MWELSPHESESMVDVDSALRASAYSEREIGVEIIIKKHQRKVLSHFDPQVHATKEVADAYSMWLVIIYGTIISIIMRYIFMPTQETMEGIIWLLPVILTATVPSLHKIIIPKNIVNYIQEEIGSEVVFYFYFHGWLFHSYSLIPSCRYRPSYLGLRNRYRVSR